RTDRIHAKVESLAVLEREDVVKHAVVVRKVDRRAHADSEYVRIEIQIALIEDDLDGLRAVGRVRRVEPDHDVRDGPTGRTRRAAHGQNLPAHRAHWKGRCGRQTHQ